MLMFKLLQQMNEILNLLSLILYKYKYVVVQEISYFIISYSWVFIGLSKPQHFVFPFSIHSKESFKRVCCNLYLVVVVEVVFVITSPSSGLGSCK